MKRHEIVTKHLTSDGMLIESVDEAVEHQNKLDFALAIEEALHCGPELRIGWNIIENAPAVVELLLKYINEKPEVVIIS